MELKKLYEANKWWDDRKFQLHWHKLEWVYPESTPKRDKPYSVSSKSFTLIKMTEQLILLAILNLKNYISMIFLRKQMNEEMEAELTEMDSRTDNFEVFEDASVDEAFTIDLRK